MVIVRLDSWEQQRLAEAIARAAAALEEDGLRTERDRSDARELRRLEDKVRWAR